MQVSEYICTSANAACDMELKELQWGRMWQVNVIKIIRGKKHINIPEGDEKLYAGDRLYLLGTAKAQENFNLFNEQRNLLLEGENDNVSLHAFIENQDEYTEEQQLFSYAVTVKKGTPLAGCSVRDSAIKSKWNAYLIGVERNMMPMMNLNANFILNADDLLWVLGPQKMGEQLVKYEML